MGNVSKDFQIANGVLKRYKGPGGDVVIPAGVTVIGEKAFYNSVNVTSVTIPKGVTVIEGCAFYGCTGLTGVTLPEGLKEISNEVFCNGNLTSIQIPGSVEKIGAWAFSDCTALEQVEFLGKIPDIRAWAFQNVPWLEHFGDLAILDGVLLKCFRAEGHVTLPEDVTVIGEASFSGRKEMTGITLPAGLTRIGFRAFEGCSGLERVDIPGGVETLEYAAFKDCTGLTEVKLSPGLKNIKGRCFKGCGKLAGITLPEGLTEISWGVFQACTSLTELTIPASVTSMDVLTFEGCKNLNTITLLGSKTHLPPRTFEGCEAEVWAERLPLGKLPESVRERSLVAFAKEREAGTELSPELRNNYIKYLKRMRLKLFPRALEQRPLFYLLLRERLMTEDDFPELLELTIQRNEAELTAAMLSYQTEHLKPVDPEQEFEKQMAILETNTLPVADAKKIWRYEKKPDGTLRILGWKGKETQVMVPSKIGKDTVTEVGPLAFSPLASPLSAQAREQRRAIVSIGFPAEIEKIAFDAMLLCKGLREIIVDGGNKKFLSEDGCLYVRRGKRLRHIPQGRDGVLYVPRGVRGSLIGANCKGDESITALIWDGGYIPESAFSHCKNLKRVELGSSVDRIFRFAFSDCKNLEEVQLSEGLTKIDSFAFDECKKLSEIVFPKGLTELEPHAFAWCGLVRAVLPDNLKRLDDTVFLGCQKLTCFVRAGSATEAVLKKQNIPFQTL